MKTVARILAVCVVVSIASTALPHAQDIRGKNGDMRQGLREGKPDCAREAKEQRIEGLVEMSVVVKDDGSVGDVTVTKSLDQKYGLDDQAVIAMKKWQFRPGTKDG